MIVLENTLCRDTYASARKTQLFVQEVDEQDVIRCHSLVQQWLDRARQILTSLKKNSLDLEYAEDCVGIAAKMKNRLFSKCQNTQQKIFICYQKLMNSSEKNVLGMMILSFENNHLFANRQDCVIVDLLLTHPDHVIRSHSERIHGIGSALIQCAEKVACQANKRFILLESTLSAIEFYERKGFEEIESQVFQKEVKGVALSDFSEQQPSGTDG